MSAVTEFTRPTAAIQGIKVIDSDTHFSEPYDLWTSRAPAKYRDLMPRVKKTDEGLTWIIDEDTSLGSSMATSSIHKSGRKAIGAEFFKWMNEDVTPGSYDLDARLKDMDEMGVHAQIVYPNVLGFGGQKSFLVDETLRRVSVEVYNDAMAEMQAQSNGRFYPMALMPWWDIKLAVAEAERCVKMGLKGINTNPDPHQHGLPDLATDYWSPLWELCTDQGLPVNFHIGASDLAVNVSMQGWPSLSFDQWFLLSGVMLFIGNSRVLANLLMSGCLEKFPKLKLVSVESGIGWIPFLLESVEHQLREARIDYKTPPDEVFKRQIYACTHFEKKHFVEDARRVGIDNVMFESDYPHPTCVFPDPLGQLGGVIEALTREEREKVFSSTAARVYNIPV